VLVRVAAATFIGAAIQITIVWKAVVGAVERGAAAKALVIIPAWFTKGPQVLRRDLAFPPRQGKERRARRGQQAQATTPRARLGQTARQRIETVPIHGDPPSITWT
jgi:hypothetical protein